jgi:hypothetical protein
MGNNMAINLEVLGPRGEDELEAFAIEALVFAAQLAEKLDMSPARTKKISKGS